MNIKWKAFTTEYVNSSRTRKLWNFKFLYRSQTKFVFFEHTLTLRMHLIYVVYHYSRAKRASAEECTYQSILNPLLFTKLGKKYLQKTTPQQRGYQKSDVKRGE